MRMTFVAPPGDLVTEVTEPSWLVVTLAPSFACCWKLAESFFVFKSPHPRAAAAIRATRHNFDWTACELSACGKICMLEAWGEIGPPSLLQWHVAAQSCLEAPQRVVTAKDRVGLAPTGPSLVPKPGQAPRAVARF
jgi:hypothetical protein